MIDSNGTPVRPTQYYRGSMTEIMNWETMEWELGPDYPYHPGLVINESWKSKELYNLVFTHMVSFRLVTRSMSLAEVKVEQALAAVIALLRPLQNLKTTFGQKLAIWTFLDIQTLQSCTEMICWCLVARLLTLIQVMGNFITKIKYKKFITCFSEVEVWDVENGTGQLSDVLQSGIQIYRGRWAFIYPVSSDFCQQSN